MKEKKVRWIFFLESLKKNQKRVIITILLGSNTVNILIPTLGTIWVTSTYGNTPLEDLAMGVSTFVLTITILLFGEILPKSFAVTYNEKFSLFVSPFLYFVSRVFFPIIWVFEKLSDLVAPDGEKKSVSEEEVLALVSMSEEHGDITAEEKNLISNLLEFSDTTVSDVMTPRTKIVGIDENTKVSEAITFFRDHTHSRIPVYQDNVDHIIEIVTLRDVFDAVDENSSEKLIKNLDLKTPYFVPVTKKISDLFKDFQRQHIHLAIVVDEFGGTAGLVTMEDLVEEIFGDIQDETDDHEDEVKKIDDSTWVCDPRLLLSDLEDVINEKVFEDSSLLEKNISLYILETLGRFPRRGESIEMEKLIFVIEKMGNRAIERVRVIKK